MNPAPQSTGQTRQPSAVDAIAEKYLDDALALDPFRATGAGVPGLNDQVSLYSPEIEQERTDLARSALAALDSIEPADAVDDVTTAAMRDRLGLEIELAEAGFGFGMLNVIDCPVQIIRMVFDLAPNKTEADWADIAARMRAIPSSVDSYLRALDRRVDEGNPPARRQAVEAIAQCEQIIGNGSGEGFFATMADSASPDGSQPSAALATDLQAGAQAATQAYATMAQHLREVVTAAATDNDAAGQEAYALHSRYFVGAAVDLAETYEWGQAELARIEAEMAHTAEQIQPGATVQEAITILESDPARSMPDAESFRQWMQCKSDAAVRELADTHFDIPEPIRTLECRIAPTTSGVVYYTPPSLDFSRPGRMWWAVPDGMETFATWQELTTVYHEGVPGHHLQIAQTLYRADILNRWRRLLFISGHGEGWALYAERLMAGLGYLDDPGDRMGMLAASAFRATRVVVDIGLHCGFPAPAEVGGTWTPDSMWEYLRRHVLLPEPQLRFEFNRYLGWPGQAPSYKVGERLWTRIRHDASARNPDSFDLKAFHRQALDLGAVPLDVLADQLT